MNENEYHQKAQAILAQVGRLNFSIRLLMLEREKLQAEIVKLDADFKAGNTFSSTTTGMSTTPTAATCFHHEQRRNPPVDAAAHRIDDSLSVLVRSVRARPSAGRH